MLGSHGVPTNKKSFLALFICRKKGLGKTVKWFYWIVFVCFTEYNPGNFLMPFRDLYGSGHKDDER